jgi:putative hydrolase of the HAD superfamily
MSGHHSHELLAASSKTTVGANEDRAQRISPSGSVLGVLEEQACGDRQQNDATDEDLAHMAIDAELGEVIRWAQVDICFSAASGTKRMTQVRAVLFDLDQTLVDRRQTLRAFLKSQYAEFRSYLGVHCDDVSYVSASVKADDDGRVSKEDMYEVLRQQLHLNASIVPDLVDHYRRVYPGFAIPTSGALELISDLRRLRLKTGIISNGTTPSQIGKLRALGILELLDVVLIADAIDLRKPDSRVFQLALETIDETPSTTMFVGDDPLVDIVGASSAGLRTTWIRDERTWPAHLAPQPDFEVDTLVGYSKLLAGLG